MNDILTVTQLTRYISARFKEDTNLKGILLRGEISNFKYHSATGHIYFTLKDRDSAIKAVMFNQYASGLKFSPASGMSVIVQGDVRVFERDGVYQLYAVDILPDGVGTLYLRFEQLKERLSSEGLFDERYKKPIPTMPHKIGIITATDGAAFKDIVNVLERRYPLGELLLFPASVQGAEAEASICRALSAADKSDCDVLIVGRGGGSLEDLSVFNSEAVARAVFACKIPVVSAVGHETDTTIIDFVADLRAPTPSAAAELVSPDSAALTQKLLSAKATLAASLLNSVLRAEETLKSSVSALVERREKQLLTLQDKLSLLSIEKQIERSESTVKKNVETLDMLIKNLYNKKEAQLVKQAELLDSLSPLKVLTRGYAAVYREDAVITRADSLEKGDIITVKFGDGDITAEVIGR